MDRGIVADEERKDFLANPGFPLAFAPTERI
jgi:hypothetical protein